MNAFQNAVSGASPRAAAQRKGRYADEFTGSLSGILIYACRKKIT